MINKKWLELKNIHISYNQTNIFNNLNLSLKFGQHTVLMGPNGSGKSTLIKTITRLKYPLYKENSYIKIYNSERPNVWELRSKISFVCKELELRIKDNIQVDEIILSGFQGAFGLINKDLIRPEHNDMLTQIKNRFNIHYSTKYFSELSDGEKRTVLLARSLINNPEILILDEPTSMLDIKCKYNLLNILRKLSQKEVTIFYTTNNIESIIPETCRIILLKHGQIIADGKPSEVMTNSNISYLYDYSLNLLNNNGYWTALPKG